MIKKFPLLVLLLLSCAFQANAQTTPNIFVSNCDHCPTQDLQINVTPDGECGFAFDYSGLIGCTVVEANWKFGIPALPIGSATGNYVYFEFPYTGTHTVTLTLTLSDGTKTCYKTISTTVVVDPNACNPQLICTGGAYAFGDMGLDVFVGPDCIVFFGRTSSPAPGSPWQIIDMTWNFGNGFLFHGVSAGVSYQFDRDGTYTVCMTVTMSDGIDTCQKKFCRQVSVSGCGPNKKGTGLMATLPDAIPLNIFPNPIPAGSRLTLGGNIDPFVHEITMVDAQGRIVERWNITDNAKAEQVFSLPSGISPGIYFLQSNSPTMPVQKLIVQ